MNSTLYDISHLFNFIKHHKGMKKILFAALFVLSFFTSAFAQAQFTFVDKNQRYWNPGNDPNYPVHGSYVDTHIDLYFHADPSISLLDWTHTWHYELTNSSAGSQCPDEAGDVNTGQNPNLFLRIGADCHYLVTMTHIMCHVSDPNNCQIWTDAYQTKQSSVLPTKFVPVAVRQNDFTFHNSKGTSATITLLDMTGRVFYVREVSPYTDATLDTANFAAGIYLLSVRQDGKITTQKVLKAN
jgi:hypothetical protein